MPRRSLTSSAVIARAAAIADADGLTAVTLAAVARSLDVQTPSLYTHVRDLAALRDGITVLALGELSDRIAAAIAGRSAREALDGFASAHRSFARERPGLWESLQRTAGPDAVAAPAARRVVQLTDAVLLGYAIPAEDRVHAVRVLGAALNGFLTLERLGSFAHSSPPAAQSWGELLDSLHFLLSRWTRRKDSPA
ncbi:TetR family transcriptional regulator [Rathayibacter sp. AY2B3]|uniref:TetR-like C-terminal domain-containing protein n=1 Tax=Rathayibacter sp. AY2B3 TaxID=2080569 RepID=UPI000CE8FCAD|nr:TetR-like C-terminal domain-containing protein [Rathayibacter sp. AY2B3]PPG51846.1 TetR family transcriptional regulator [Rathayibacter sp. AY2B3]